MIRRNKNAVAPGKHSGWKIDALEQRLMLAGDVAAAVSTPTQSVPTQDTTVTAQQTSITFIDANLEDLDAIAGTIAANTEIVLLTNDSDPIEQITRVLAQRNGVQSVHLIGHGQSGQIAFGNNVIDAESLNAHQSDCLLYTSPSPRD